MSKNVHSARAEDQRVRVKSPLKKVASVSLGIVSLGLRIVHQVAFRTLGLVHTYRMINLEFELRPGDIFIVTYPRSGTTWLQMILYQLTTDGDLDKLVHISEHIPFLENALVISGAHAFDDIPSPRMFKTHLAYQGVPKGPCKYIYVARNGKDVLVSAYHHEVSGRGYKGNFTEFADRFMRGRLPQGSWFDHVAGWYKHKDDPNVLFLTYEELTANLENCLRRIIDFCGFEVAPERLSAITERCRFEVMKKYQSKFSPASEMEMRLGINRGAFIRKGQIGGWKELMSGEQEALFDQKYREELGTLGVRLDA